MPNSTEITVPGIYKSHIDNYQTYQTFTITEFILGSDVLHENHLQTIGYQLSIENNLV